MKSSSHGAELPNPPESIVSYACAMLVTWNGSFPECSTSAPAESSNSSRTVSPETIGDQNSPVPNGPLPSNAAVSWSLFGEPTNSFTPAGRLKSVKCSRVSSADGDLTSTIHARPALTENHLP